MLNARAFRVVIVAASSVTGLALAGCGHQPPATKPAPVYLTLLKTLYHNTVPRLTVARLAQELAVPPVPLLLDVRTPAEFRVSHLAGAQFVNADSIATVQLPGIDRQQPVVVYCSVGVRSERLGERLLALGFRNVRNLQGGIFEWVNEGHPVVNAAGPTADIHPFSTFWGLWLRRGNKVND